MNRPALTIALIAAALLLLAVIVLLLVAEPMTICALVPDCSDGTG